jgi:hypothetical protein
MSHFLFSFFIQMYTGGKWILFKKHLLTTTYIHLPQITRLRLQSRLLVGGSLHSFGVPCSSSDSQSCSSSG